MGSVPLKTSGKKNAVGLLHCRADVTQFASDVCGCERRLIGWGAFGCFLSVFA